MINGEIYNKIVFKFQTDKKANILCLCCLTMKLILIFNYIKKIINDFLEGCGM